MFFSCGVQSVWAKKFIRGIEDISVEDIHVYRFNNFLIFFISSDPDSGHGVRLNYKKNWILFLFPPLTCSSQQKICESKIFKTVAYFTHRAYVYRAGNKRVPFVQVN